MAIRPLPGYPMPVGEKYLVIADYLGPLSYVNGTGDKLVAGFGGGLNQGGIEFVSGGNSVSGTYNIKIFYPSAATTSSTSQPGANASVIIKWYVLATGLEVANATNLSAEVVRLRIDTV